jgi:transcriptional regulator with XRE-family HTH domain
MRPSPHRHTLAVLRTFLGLTQKEMADIAECSRPTIQAIELCKLPLSDKLAKRIEHETGIGLEWLLTNDPAKPPLNGFGGPYTREMFDRYRASKNRSTSDPNDFYYMQGVMALALAEISNMVLESYQTGRLDLCGFKLKQTLADLRKELGVTGRYGLKSAGDIATAVFENTASYAIAKLENKPLRTPPNIIRLTTIIDEFEQEFYKLYKKKSKAR